MKFNALNLGRFKTLNYDLLQTIEEFKAPEELSNKSIEKPSTKARVFHLGMLILYMTTLQDIRGLNKDLISLEETIKELEEDYSRFVIELLQKMLVYDEKDRMDFDQLLQFIKENETILKKDAKIQYKAPNKVSVGNSATSWNIQTSPGKIPDGFQTYRTSYSTLDKGPFGSKSNSKQPKLLKEEQVYGAPKLSICYERSKPTFKTLHMFLEGTMNLAVVSLKQMNSLFVEMIALEMSFTIPKQHTSIYTENERFYLVGGRSEHPRKSNCYYCTTSDHVLQAVKPGSEKTRLNPGVVNIGGLLFVMGGFKSSGTGYTQIYDPLTSCEVLRINEGEWRPMAKLNFGAIGASYCSFGLEYIYKIGGTDKIGFPCKVIERYSLRVDKWQVLDHIPNYSEVKLARDFVGVQVNPKEIFVFGGVEEKEGTVNESFMWDTRQMEENRESIVSVNRHCPSIFELGTFRANQAVVLNEQIVFMSFIDPGFRVCSFDGSAWKEIKRFERKDCSKDRESVKVKEKGVTFD